ncbi:MAG: hypothetical protein AB1505_17170 [Candidatus Latescibacterota bacterium]
MAAAALASLRRTPLVILSLAAVLAVAALLRCHDLAAPLNHDEAYTWEAFSSRSYATIATYYPVPNNHVLHSLLVGTAGQPRSYLYGAAYASLLAAYGATAGIRRAPWQWPVVAVALLGLLWLDGADLLRRQGEGIRGVGRYLQASSQPGDVIVSPHALDVEVWHYARPAIQRGLLSALSGRSTGRLLFVGGVGGGRFSLQDCELIAAVGSDRQRLMPDPESLQEVHRDGSRVACQVRRPSLPLLSAPLAWRLAPGSPVGLEVGAGGKAVTPASALRVVNPGGGEFALYSAQTARAPGDGTAVLVQARTDETSEVSLYRVEPGATGPAVRELPGFQTAAKPAKLAGRDGQLWFLEAFLVPVEEGGEYGVFVRGRGTQAQHFADWVCTFYPVRTGAQMVPGAGTR